MSSAVSRRGSDIVRISASESFAENRIGLRRGAYIARNRYIKCGKIFPNSGGTAGFIARPFVLGRVFCFVKNFGIPIINKRKD